MASKFQESGKKLPNRILFYGDTGTGKTSFAAHAPKPIFILTPDEDGLNTLCEQNLAPRCPYATATSWDTGDYGLLNLLQDIVDTNDDRKTLVIDTLNGAQNLCFKKVCANKYDSDMTKFLDYGKGPEVALPVWDKLFPLLNTIREKRGMTIIMLAHSTIKAVKNPNGDQFESFIPRVHDKLTHTINAWADMTLFVQRVPVTKKEGMKTKVLGLTNLRIVTTQQPFCSAKNRFGLPDFIEVEDEQPASIMASFVAALKAAKAVNDQRGKTPEPAAQPAA